MSKPRLLDAYTPNSKTITVEEPDYTVVVGWSDSNPADESRVGYFVSKDLDTSDIAISIASKDSKILGITVDSPGFATNVTKSMCDECGTLLSRYAYVCFAGFATVIDNGTCEVNGMCIPSDEGTAIPSNNKYGYQVIDRIDDTHILILIEPQGDIVSKVFNSLHARVEGSVLRIGR